MNDTTLDGITVINYEFIGWCNEDNHDKVWVAFSIDKHFYCAWGRRGAKLQFKDHGMPRFLPIPSQLNKLIRKKKDKGYQLVDEFMLFSIFPDFKEKVEQELVIKLMSGKVH